MTTPDKAPSPCSAIEDALAALDRETDAMEDVWHLRPEALARLVEQAEAEHCDDLAQRLRWETMLAYAYTSSATHSEEVRPRFMSFHQDLTQDAALDYLVTRAASDSAYVRSRALDFLWEYGGSTRKRVAVDAGGAYLQVASLEAAKATRENFGWLRVGDAVVRAAQLSKAANQLVTMRATIDLALQLTRDLISDGNYRFVLDMAVALTALARKLNTQEQDSVHTSLRQTAGAFLAEDNFHLARVALGLLRGFTLATGRHANEAPRAIDIEIARICVEEGERREGEGKHLVASISYQQALELLEDIGSEPALAAKVRVALRRTREAGMGEMTTVSSGPITLSEEHQAHIEQVVAEVADRSSPDCFQLFALHPALRLTLGAVHRLQATQRQSDPLTQMVPRVTMRSAGQVLAPSDPAEAERLQVMQVAIQGLRVQDALYVIPIFERLLARDDLSPDMLTRQVMASGNVAQSRGPIVEMGFRRMWERDWISAIHVLVPQLEEVMRTMLRRVGHDTMRGHKVAGVTLEVPLAYVLDQLASVILDDDLIFMLNVMLDLYGLNLRDQVAHGLIEAADCEVGNMARVLQLYLMLAMLRPAATTGDEPPAEQG